MHYVLIMELEGVLICSVMLLIVGEEMPFSAINPNCPYHDQHHHILFRWTLHISAILIHFKCIEFRGFDELLIYLSRCLPDSNSRSLSWVVLEAHTYAWYLMPQATIYISISVPKAAH